MSASTKTSWSGEEFMNQFRGKSPSQTSAPKTSWSGEEFLQLFSNTQLTHQQTNKSLSSLSGEEFLQLYTLLSKFPRNTQQTHLLTQSQK